MACAVFVIFYLTKLKDWQILKKLLIHVGLILLIVAFFYVPMIEHKMDTDYAIFNEYKATGVATNTARISLNKLLFSKMQWGWALNIENDTATEKDMCYAIGLTLIIPLLFTPFVYKKIKKTHRRLYIASIFISILFMALTTEWIDWTKVPYFFSFVQFPFRYLMIPSFLLSIVGAVNIAKVSEKFSKRDVLMVSMIAVIYITPLMQSAKITGLDENQFYEVERLDATQPTSLCCAKFEYLPSKAFQNREYLANRSQDPILIEGEGEIKNSNKDKSSLTFDFTNTNGKEAKIELPYLYYLGYSAEINGKKLEMSESDKGFVAVTIPENESGTVEVSFTGTTLTKISMAVSIIGTILFIAYVIYSERKVRGKNKILKLKGESK